MSHLPPAIRARRRVLYLGTGLSALVAAARYLPPARAQAPWPNRPIKLIVPYPAGGNSDLIGRLVAEKLSGSLGVQVVVENRAGAGASIGAQAAARSAADGYTLLLAPTAVLAITQHLRKLPYDADNDFTAIAQVSSSYGIVAARKDLPANNMAQFVALAKQSPGKLSFGSAGVATATHLSGEIVHHQAGISVLHVPYKGSAESLNDLVGGRIDLIYDPVALAQIKAGNLKALAVTSAQRHPELPGIATLAEQGLPVPGSSWFGLFAPKGVPAEIINRISAELEKAMTGPGVREQLLKFSQYPEFRGPVEFARQVGNDSAFYKDLIQRTGIKAE